MEGAEGTPITHTCEACGTEVRGAGLAGFGDAFIAHVRADHPDWPYPDVAVRNYAEATQRLTGSTERLERLVPTEIHPVTPERIADWLTFFDHDAFAGNPAWAACYCSEPHLHPRGAGPGEDEPRTWEQSREVMHDFLRSGRSVGYLAYVDGRPAAWVNASRRDGYSLYREGDAGDIPDESVVGISCFIVAPPYRRHGLAEALLEQVLADAAGRGATWVEAYPFTEEREGDAGNFRGPMSMYRSHGFEPVGQTAHWTVVRRPA